MNSPPTPPYCGSVAAALHLMKSQCGSCREKGMFIALRWMQPDRGMMWPAENPELAREFPAGTASKARQSRLHQAQGVFPVFVFHSFVQFLNNSCSKKFSPLMPINCLVNCPINQRVKETKRRREKERKRERRKDEREEGRKDRFFETLMFMNYPRIDHELIFGT